jgi:hypothetical protein
VTVDELIEELRGMPQTAVVEVQIRKNVTEVGKLGFMENEHLEDLYEFREAPIVTVVYDLGRVQIQLDE